MTPGQQIRRYRMAAGLTSADLARQAGISRGYLSEIENEHASRPGIGVVANIANALGVSIVDLLDEQPPPVRCKHWAIQWATAPGGAIECQSCGHTWEIQP